MTKLKWIPKTSTGDVPQPAGQLCVAWYQEIAPDDETLLYALAHTLGECQRLREALLPFTTVPCEYRGNIHCSMIPADAGVRFCAPCAARAALNEVTL